MRVADHPPEHLVLARGAHPSGPLCLHLLPGEALLRPDTSRDLCTPANLRVASLAPRRKRPRQTDCFPPFSTRFHWLDSGRDSGHGHMGLGHGHIHRCRCPLLGCIHHCLKPNSTMVDDEKTARILVVLDLCGCRRHRSLRLQVASHDFGSLCRVSCHGNNGFLCMAQDNRLCFR